MKLQVQRSLQDGAIREAAGVFNPKYDIYFHKT